MSIKLDLKKFKYHSADKDSATLVHQKDGHQIRLALKALSPATLKQLETLKEHADAEMKSVATKVMDEHSGTFQKLAKHDTQPQQLAEGGEVKKAKDFMNAVKMEAPVIATEEELIYPAGEPRNILINALGLPDSLKISQADRKRFDANFAENVGMGTMGSVGKAIPRIKNIGGKEIMAVDGALGQTTKGANLANKPVVNQAAPVNYGKILGPDGRPLVNRSAYAEGGEIEDQYLMPITVEQQVAEQMPISEVVDTAALQAMDPMEVAPVSVEEYSGRNPAMNPALRSLQNHQAIQEATQMGATVPEVASGIATRPEEIIPAPLQPVMNAEGEVSEAASMAPQMQQQQALDPMGKMKAGINAEAQAVSDLAQAQQQIIDKQIIAQQTVKEEFDSKYNRLEAERQAFMDDINTQTINPEKYWTGDPKTGMGGHSKIMAGIGMIIAGFNPTNSPNAAIKFLEKQMDMNLEAQKANLQSKHNLLAANMRQFGNLKDATDMTRIMQADMVKNQLMSAAAKAQTPMAKAQALKAAADIEMKYAPLQMQIANRQAVASLMKQGQQNPEAIPLAIDALEKVDPKQAAQLRERYVPGVGIASTNEGAKGLREMDTTVKTVQDSISKLRKIAKQTGKSLSPSARAEADTLRSTLIGRLRVPITGPGAMSEGERALLERAVPDVAGMMSLDSSNLKRLDTLEKTMNNNYDNMKRANGIINTQQAPSQNQKRFNFKPVGK